MEPRDSLDEGTGDEERAEGGHRGNELAVEEILGCVVATSLAELEASETER